MNLVQLIRQTSIVNPPRITVVAEPSVDVWTAADAEVSQWLRQDSSADTALVNLILKAARKQFERLTGLALITQTLQVSYDLLPPGAPQYNTGIGVAASPLSTYALLPSAGREIVLGRAPLQSVTSFKYLDSTGTLTTFAAGNYTAGNVGVAHAFGSLWLNDGSSWPDTGTFPNALQIQFTAGFGAARANVPEDICMAILWLAAHWYENRLPVSETNTDTPLPFHLGTMIDHHRVACVA